MSRLAVLHGAAALAFAGVLASATSVAALAAALALAGILAGAVMGCALVLLLVGDSAGIDGGFLELGRAVHRGVGFGGEAAGNDARERGASEECFGGIDAFHVVCGFVALFFVFLNAPAPEFTGECIQKVGVG